MVNEFELTMDKRYKVVDSLTGEIVEEMTEYPKFKRVGKKKSKSTYVERFVFRKESDKNKNREYSTPAGPIRDKLILEAIVASNMDGLWRNKPDQPISYYYKLIIIRQLMRKNASLVKLNESTIYDLCEAWIGNR